MVISGSMTCRLRRRIGRTNQVTNHHAGRTMLGCGDVELGVRLTLARQKENGT